MEIIIVDFGSQTTHLISRRLRELGVSSLIINPEEVLEKTRKNTKGVILSGGPQSVYEDNSPTIDKKVFELDIPILGICYGQQLTAQLLGGKVKPGKRKEYGPALLKRTKDHSFFKNTALDFRVWMSHGDEISKLPPGFERLAKTSTIPYAAIFNDRKRIYGVQFHPEVIHTEFGEEILKNFIKICALSIKRQKVDKNFVESLIKDIKESAKDTRAISALSGGVDSAVATLLVHKALGNNLRAIYIDSGLMRQDETKVLREAFKKHFHVNIKIVDAKDIFLKNLKSITDPEEKRKKIGETFIRIFEKEAKEFKTKFLVQGTIYPDVIESAGTKHSHTIKSHHNVGGLPEDMDFLLIEPLRMFYKDEVRRIGKILGLPEEIVKRQPFPGPGLAIRIIGEVTDYKLQILRKADFILQQEIKRAKLDKKLWQAFAIFTDIKTTGVRGDQRAYGETIAIRALEAQDAMTAHWARLPYELIDKISTRIVNEIKEVNRVVYDVTNKPPATMEWE